MAIPSKSNLGSFTVLSALALGVLAPGIAQSAERPSAQADLMSSSGKKIGTAELSQSGDRVKIEIEASGLPPGKHGIHFHQKGQCKGPDFKSAGEHFAHEGTEHGLKNPEGPHYGDLPNLDVGKDGKVSETVVSTRVSLAPGAKDSLLKSGGTALVIHAKADDQKSDPSGGSGDRIACGVIKAAS